VSTNPPSDNLDDLFNLPVTPKGEGKQDASPPEVDPEAIFQPLEPETIDAEDEQFKEPTDNEVTVYRPLPKSQPEEIALPVYGPVCYTIALPKDTQWDAAQAHSLMEKLVSINQDMTFQIVADGRAIQWQVIDTGVQEADPTRIVATIRSVVPQAAIQTAVYAEPPFQQPFTRLLVPFAQHAPYFAPIQYPDDLRAHDPLITLTNLFNQAQTGERVVYLVHVGRADPKAYDRAWKQISRSNFNAGNIGVGVANLGLAVFANRGWMNIALTGMAQITGEIAKGVWELSKPERREPKFVNELQRMFWVKINDFLFHTYILVQIDVADPARLQAYTAVLHTLYEFKTEHQALMPPAKSAKSLEPMAIADAAQASERSAFALVEEIARTGRVPRGWQATSIFNPKELATLWHLPHAGFAATKIAWAKKHVPTPSVMQGKRTGVQLGTNHAYGETVPVFMPRDARVSHAYVVGKTGFGKSNLLHHLIHQDIAAGYGVCVVDPHGTLVSDILRYSIPAGREDDVVVLDISCESHPIPLNMLAVPAELDRESRVTQLDALFKRYGNFADTVTLAPTLWNCLLLLQSERTPILRDIPKILNNPSYRERLRAQAERNFVLEDFWEAFENKSEALRDSTTVVPLSQRVSDFYSNTALALMTCHPDMLDFRRRIAEGKIILFSLYDPNSKWKDEHKSLLGGILVAQVTMGAWARGVHGKPFYLYVDEVENFVTAPIPKILEQARKYSLSLTLASQHLSQLKGDVLKSVMGTVGAFAAFQVGHDDAGELVHYLPGFERTDLINMDKHHAAFRMQYGEGTYAFTLKTLAPFDQGHKGIDAPLTALQREMLIRERSLRNYTPKTREEVLTWLSERDKKAAPKPKKSAASKKKLSPDDFLSKKPEAGIDE
jgi:hypothetical protein